MDQGKELMPPLPPGPKGDPSGKLNYESLRTDMFGFLSALIARYGDVVGFDLGRSPCILVNSPSLVRALFLNRGRCLRKPEFVKDSNRGHWADGLTTLEGPAWQARRTMLRASFKARPFSHYASPIAECTEDMLDQWAIGREVDLAKELRILTARIAARIVLDAEIEGYGPVDRRSGVLPFAEAYGEDYISTPGGDTTAPLVIKRLRAPRRMDETIRIIDRRIAESEDRRDLLSCLVRARLPDGKRLGREELIGEVIQMLYAGHLTIPSCLVNFWRDICATETAAAIAAEADRLDTASPRALLFSPASPCLAALRESMRLHPPAPILYREVESAFELGGFAFPRDVALWVSPQLLHHDERNFPQPHRFLPDRFVKGSSMPASASCYFPFGAGRRTCIANHLALHQMTLIGLLTARRFELTPLNGAPNGFRVGKRGDLFC
jgi:enediyne biosynthesis protein E7